MKGWMRWFILALMAGLVAFLLWATLTPSPLVIITWHAPYRIHYSDICDLDGDGDEEVFVYNQEEGKGHLLHIRNGVWQEEEEVPVTKGWEYAGALYPSVLLFRDLSQDSLMVLWRNKVWHLEKLERIRDYHQGDLDGDGVEDDLLVLSFDGVVYWYELQRSFPISVSDKILLPKSQWADLDDLYIYIEQGRLKFRPVRCPKRSWHRWVTLHLSDMDGDEREEQLVYTECEDELCEIAEVSIELSRTGQKERVRLPFPVTRLLEELEGDFDGDGQKEMLVSAERNGKFVLLRLWRERRNWKYEVMPAHIAKSYRENIEEIMRIGDRDWIFLFFPYSKGLVRAIYRTSNKGWQQKVWKFKGYIGGLWQDSDGVGVVIFDEIWLSENPAWNWLRQVSLRLQDLGVPVPVLPYNLTRIEIWRWNQKQQNWRREARTLFTNTDLLPYCLLITEDLNKDERDELLIGEEHSGIFRIFAFQTGRRWRRWQFLKLWGPPFDTLTADGQEWLVVVEERRETVRALTLR